MKALCARHRKKKRAVQPVASSCLNVSRPRAWLSASESISEPSVPFQVTPNFVLGGGGELGQLSSDR